jgi:hypothetical protein
LTFNSVGAAPANLYRQNYDAPRAYPIASSISNIAVTLNNTTVSLNTSDVIQALLRYNTGVHLKNHDYSLTPNYPDQSQNYSDLTGSVRSPLGNYSSQSDECPAARGSFPYTIVTNTPTQFVVDAVFTEEVYLPPFYWGCGNMGGYIGLQTLDWNINFLGASANRMWSHDPSNGGAAITSSSYQFNNFAGGFSYSQAVPTLLFEYITPKELQTIPRSVCYPYFVIDRYPTDFSALAAYGSPGSSAILNSNNIQLNSIPRRMYIYARANNTSLYAPAGSQLTDTYLAITNISVNWNNYSGLLSSASQQQLYLMSIKNHCNMSWEQWSGGPVFNGDNQSVGTVGSILCIEFGTDIGLMDQEAPGLLGTYQLQLNVTVQNMNTTQGITPTLYIVTVSEGTFTIENNRSVSQIGVISKTDILTAKQHISDYINYEDIQDIQGGNFLTGIKKFGKDIWGFLKPKIQAAYKFGKEALPYVNAALGVAKLVGLGGRRGGARVGGAYAGGSGGCQNCYGRGCIQCNKYGGAPVGGRMISRECLKDRLYQQ